MSYGKNARTKSVMIKTMTSVNIIVEQEADI